MSTSIVDYEYYKKSNILNSLSGGGFSKPSHELLIMFLMSIEPNKPPQEEVIYYVKDYQKIFGTGSRNLKYLNDVVDSLSEKKFRFIDNKGQVDNIGLFSRASLCQDENGERYFRFVPNKEAYPYFFEIAANYTQYSLKAIIGLNKLQHRLLYETLKEQIYKGQSTSTYIISYSELQRRLGSKIKDFRNFKQIILDEAKKAFDDNPYSEIRFTYEKVCGTHGKVTDIKFNITRNIIDIKTKDASFPNLLQSISDTTIPKETPEKQAPKYIDKDGISHIFEPDKDYTEEEVIEYYGNERNAEIAHSTQYEFSKDEIDEIVLLMTDLHIDIAPDDEEIHLVGRRAAEWSKKEKYIRRLYSKLQSSVERYKVKSDNRARYFIKMLENDIQKMAEERNQA